MVRGRRHRVRSARGCSARDGWWLPLSREGQIAAWPDALDFGGLLTLLREKARLTQEELARRASLSTRTVSDLERGIHLTARKVTAELLAGALGLTGPAKERFIDAALGKITAAAVIAAQAPPHPALEVRYSLPPRPAEFTGRDGELGRITAAGTGGGVVAIDGMPGVGKTALAVHAAHLLRDRFPGRQLFIGLHGHTPGQGPVAPKTALAALLAATGVDARGLPADLESRAGLWRDRMAGQRALLVLDNAASSAQVTPLLPGGRDCLVLVTSRRYLGDLPGAVTPLQLEVLPPVKAQEMFLRLAPGTAAGPAVAELVRLAGFLPLAISLLARVRARHPSWTLADLAAETRASMLTLATESNSVAAAFEVSYRDLTPGQQRFLRYLGGHLGSTADPYAAAALAGTSLAEAAGCLDALHREGLLTEEGYHRYGMHDLIRRYAQDRAAADPAAERERAVGRLLDFYTHTATIAETRLARHTQAAAGPAAPVVAVPGLADGPKALAWARAERANLLACLDHVTEAGQHTRVVALTAALAALLRQDGPWTSAVSRHATAVQAARQSGDRPGQANALANLGIVQRLTGDYPGAAQAQAEALRLFRETGGRLGQANVLHQLGAGRRMTGDYPGAAQAQAEALGLFRDLGDRHGQANALNELGDVWRMTGDHPGAARAQREALGLYREVGDPLGQVNALNYLGAALQMSGDCPGAVRAHEEALAISQELGHRHGQAKALTFLGAVRQLAGDHQGAAQALEEALVICWELGHRHGQANALNELGIVRRMTGDHQGAAQALAEALRLFHEIGDHGGEAMVLNETGTLHLVRGELGPAGDRHQQALAEARAIGSSWDEAHALAGLGRCALADGRTSAGRSLLQQAQAIFRRIGATGAAAELDALLRKQTTPR
ncbi:MAG TPA: tetratricopeptide repeat protein [Streptosporangiaceae bacterium]